jgi:hypothetical protein
MDAWGILKSTICFYDILKMKIPGVETTLNPPPQFGEFVV